MRRFLFAAIIVVCIASCVAAQNPCETNFRDSGTVFKGKTYSTSAAYASVDPKVMLQVLSRTLANDKSMSIVSIDAHSGTIVAQSSWVPGAQAPADRKYPITFKVQPALKGTSVSMQIALQTGMFASAPNAIEMMCKAMTTLARNLARMDESDRSARAKSPLRPRMKRRA